MNALMIRVWMGAAAMLLMGSGPASSQEKPSEGMTGTRTTIVAKEFPRRAERAHMVRTQLTTRDITDPRVLRVMGQVPRHLFVPLDIRRYAYADRPLPIGLSQTISQPYIVAFMTQALMVKPGHKVLEIGTGSGYQAVVLAALGVRVYTIEIVAPLGRRARKVLDALDYQSVRTRIGDGYVGWPEAAPFDRIILTAAPPKIPQPLLDQLAPGGVMVAPVGTGVQNLVRITRTKTGLRRETILPVRFVPMTGRAQGE